MKFYNPFKPHIVEHANGKFAVRRRCFWGWEYKDRKNWVSSCSKDIAWWSLGNIDHCYVNSYDEAVKVMDSRYTDKHAVVRIYRG